MIELQPNLTPENYDGIVGALTGNGELCTTLSPTGYHVAPGQRDDIAHSTQRFVLAGRRRSNAQHTLVDFGSIYRRLLINGKSVSPETWTQRIDFQAGVVISEWKYSGLKESTRSAVQLHDNLFLGDTTIQNTSDESTEIELTITLTFETSPVELNPAFVEKGLAFNFTHDLNVGLALFDCVSLMDDHYVEMLGTEHTITGRLVATLSPGQYAAVSTGVHFSDRHKFEFPLDRTQYDAAADRHEAGWQEFWSTSKLVTHNERIDQFRESSLYTLRCQATSWSIPPTLTERYWGGGAFHDELYPFYALMSAGYVDLASRIPAFRKLTLAKAVHRGRGQGALYPWSSTEVGEERDPHGLWYSERFHLGQIVEVVHALWLYTGDEIERRELYPVLREIARYVENCVITREEDGRIGTIKCVDFDESVGPVTNGPFTLCAAAIALHHAALTVRELNIEADAPLAQRWESLALELKARIQEDANANGYTIPDSRDLHSSIMGAIFPFRLDTTSRAAHEAAELIHKECKTGRGWKAGLSTAFFGTHWMWTAGHLAACHAWLSDADRAWEALEGGPGCAGPLLSPNEHIDRGGEIQVPWFTTGCGAWLYAMNAMILQVDEEGTRLLSAIPDKHELIEFDNLLGHKCVRITGVVRSGKIESLTARSDRDLRWTYRIPGKYLGESSAWLERTIELQVGVETPLIS
ncbi:MAG: hypothetical protein ABJA67_01500 [Chthonomonadales bacterium]